MQQVQNDNEIEIPTQFSHSVKIEQGQKGAQIHSSCIRQQWPRSNEPSHQSV